MNECKSIGCGGVTHEDFCPSCFIELGNNKGGSAPSVRKPQAADMLEAAAGHMRDRAATYDQPTGERSMGKTVAAFNALTGRDLNETEGWTFMELLKIARSFQGEYKQDNFEDRVAYAALAGESAAMEV